MKGKNKLLMILILGSLTALGPFSIDMYLPGFPAIAKDLNTTVAKVSLSLSGFFIGISAGQLLYGPLLDKFGRRKPLFIGLTVYILASLGCVYAHSIDQLIIWRFVQAIGSCAAAVAAIAMVRDLFPVNENAKIFALLMLVVGVSPMVAPTLGGYVIATFGWHAVFLVLMALGIINLLTSIFGLPDSYRPDPTISLKPNPIIKGFIAVALEPQFYTYALTGALAFAGLFAYVAGSPLLFMDIYGLNEKDYGWIFAILSVGLIGASQVNSVLLKKFSSEQLILAALICQTLTGILFLTGSIYGWYGVTETVVLLFIFLSCVGFASPNASALSLAPFTKNAGSASALMGAIQMGLGTLASIAISLFDVKSAVPMTAVMAGTAILALITILIGRRNISPKTAEQ